MTIKGKVVIGNDGISGAKVFLYKNGQKKEESATNSGGKFIFNELPITPEGDEYIIEISKPGHVTIKHWVSTKAPDDRKTLFPTYFPEVELFKTVNEVEKEKALTAILVKPISKFSYNTRKGDFEDDGAYFSTIKAQVTQLFEILEAEKKEQYRLLAEYRLKKMEEEKKNEAVSVVKVEKPGFQEQYQSVLDQADESFLKKKYKEALSLYGEVMSVISKSNLPKSERDRLKAHPKQRIYELETLIAEGKGEMEEKPEETEDNKTNEAVGQSKVVNNNNAALTELKEAEKKNEMEISENKAIKAKQELEIVEALAERDRLKREKKEEIDSKRQEVIENTAVQNISAEIAIKDQLVSIEIANREAELKKSQNKEIKAKTNEDLIKMMAEEEAKKNLKKLAAQVSSPLDTPENSARGGSASGGKTTEEIRKEPANPLATVEKGVEKVLKEDVKLVHHRFKVTPEALVATEKPGKISREINFKPKKTEIIDESIYKTVKSTIIQYPVKQDTFQEVNYLWGAVYYYKNSVEIDGNTYINELGKF